MDFCADINYLLSVHSTDHNLNNLGIRQEIWENLFGKIDFVFETIRKNRFSDPKKPEKSISALKVFGKIDFHYAGEVTHPNAHIEMFILLHG